MTAEQLAGRVLRIERSSIHDGDGLRTVVFLKGCPMRCAWCSTPESQEFCQEVSQDGKTVYGRKMTVGEVMAEVRKDSLFYFMSGGGMTLSGGEILGQPAFTKELLRQACQEGISTAVETSLFGCWRGLEPMLPYIHILYADLKLVSSDQHKKYCGVCNQVIRENLKKLDTSPEKFRLIVRTPLIPGINDGREELEKIGAFCQGLHRMEALQLLPYHRLGEGTYAKLGRPYTLKGVESPSPEHMEACRKILRRYLKNVL